jgi:hypothetical protein
MDNQVSTNGQLDCAEPTIQLCVADRCSCAVPYTTTVPHGMRVAQATRSSPRCEVTIGYPQNHPEQPSVYFANGDCAMNAEVALAMVLSFLLKGTYHNDVP